MKHSVFLWKPLVSLKDLHTDEEYWMIWGIRQITNACNMHEACWETHN